MDLLVLAQDVGQDVVEVAGQDRMAETILFWVLAVIGMGSGIGMVVMRNIVHGALLLVLNFLAIAGLFLVLQSGFLSIVQVIVYAGAIMVLFLFVIMLLGVDRDDALIDTTRLHRVGAVLVGLAVVGALVFSLVGTFTSAGSRCGDQVDTEVLDQRTDAIRCEGLDRALAEQDGSVAVLANRLFGRYTFPFEASALLLTVATIGAIVLGRRHDDPEDLMGDGVIDPPLPDRETESASAVDDEPGVD
ncbi:MAG: NADH-quinone oxidoreductase subunit J [Actinobacteria bacterium]|nr:NADH-quinone oxidoreductase subunit J [Actinomycetota bacterium]